MQDLSRRCIAMGGESVSTYPHRTKAKAFVNVHYCRMLLTRHYDQRPFDETVCDAIIANSGVKNPSKKVQNICDGGCIKHGSDFSCVCDAGHTVQFN